MKWTRTAKQLVSKLNSRYARDISFFLRIIACLKLGCAGTFFLCIYLFGVGVVLFVFELLVFPFSTDT